MQLDLLRKYIDQFAEMLSQQPDQKILAYYETQQNWQQHFEIDAPDFAKVYDRSLENTISRRLWKTEKYEPKRMMLLFLAQDESFARDAFRDLFNEEKSVENRIDRFVFYCDQFLELYRRANPTKIDSNHYHDYFTNSLYLSFQFPDRYAPYEPDTLTGLLRNLGVRNLPLGGDYSRHVKVTKTIYTFLEKNEKLMAAHQARLRPNKDFLAKSYLLVWEFARFVTKREG